MPPTYSIDEIDSALESMLQYGLTAKQVHVLSSLLSIEPGLLDGQEHSVLLGHFTNTVAGTEDPYRTQDYLVDNLFGIKLTVAGPNDSKFFFQATNQFRFEEDADGEPVSIRFALSEGFLELISRVASRSTERVPSSWQESRRSNDVSSRKKGPAVVMGTISAYVVGGLIVSYLLYHYLGWGEWAVVVGMGAAMGGAVGTVLPWLE